MEKSINKRGVLALLFFVSFAATAFEFSSPGPDRQLLAICQQCMDPNLASRNPNCNPITPGLMQEQIQGGAHRLPNGAPQQHMGNPFAQQPQQQAPVRPVAPNTGS